MSTHVKCRRIDLDQIARTAKPLALRHWFTVTSKSPSAHVVAHVGPAMIAIGRSPLSQPRPERGDQLVGRPELIVDADQV